MKVILLEDVKGVGKINTVQEVKDGYAVNYLIPKKLAVYYNLKNEHQLEEKLKKLALQEEENRKQANELKDKIDNLVLQFELKTNHGLSFGNISHKQVIEELKKHDIKIKHTSLSKAMKLFVGEHVLPVKIYKDIVANLRVLVIEK